MSSESTHQASETSSPKPSRLLLANPLASSNRGDDPQRRLRCSEGVARGEVERPTFGFSGASVPSMHVAGRGLMGHLAPPTMALDWDKWRTQISQIGAAESGASVFPVRVVGSRTIAAIRARCLLGTAPADQFEQAEDR